MDPIKITPTNTAAIVSALKAANGTARSYAWTTAEPIFTLIVDAEKFLRRTAQVPKKLWRGTVVTAWSGGCVPRTYRYNRTVTTVIIERRETAWYLTSVGLSSLYPSQRGNSRYTLTAAATAESVRRHRAALERLGWKS